MRNLLDRAFTMINFELVTGIDYSPARVSELQVAVNNNDTRQAVKAMGQMLAEQEMTRSVRAQQLVTSLHSRLLTAQYNPEVVVKLIDILERTGGQDCLRELADTLEGVEGVQP